MLIREMEPSSTELYPVPTVCVQIRAFRFHKKQETLQKVNNYECFNTDHGPHT